MPKQIRLVDSHVHLDLIEPDAGSLDALLDACTENNMGHLIQISTSVETHLRLRPIADRHPGLLSLALGFTPFECTEHRTVTPKFKEIVEERQIVAVGEIGLDYYRAYGTPAAQRELFAAQAAIAHTCNLPVIIHNRDADRDVFAVLAEHGGLQGVMHCFSAGAAFAEQVLDLGFYISFAGNLTFKNATAIQEAALVVPVERLLVETDAPYLAPVPLRGRPNRPWYVRHTLEFLAELKGIPPQALAQAVEDNCRRVFSLPPAPGVE